MEEKKVIHAGVTGFLLIIAIIAMAIEGIFIWKMNSENRAKEEEIASLNQTINNLNSKVSDLQGKLDKISGILGSDNSQEQEHVIDNNAILVDDLLGSYSWSKNFINDSNTELNLKVELVLSADRRAEYSASDGYSAEKTRGSFEYINGEIIYTREYYNYEGANGQSEDSKFDDENNMTETFSVIDANTLQGVYRDQIVTLKK